MKGSRRSLIIEMLRQNLDDKEILEQLDREFPPGTFKSSNSEALSGTKWDVGYKNSHHTKNLAQSKAGRMADRKFAAKSLTKADIIDELRKFKPDNAIRKYIDEYLHGKSLNDISIGTMDKTYYRAFRYETPSIRFSSWFVHKRINIVVSDVNNISISADYDEYIYNLANGLVVEWGERNDFGEKTRMNFGIAMKVVNLLMKRLAFSKFCTNDRLIPLLHVPWDKFTLTPLKGLWTEGKFNPSMGFVHDKKRYIKLADMISGICAEVGCRPIDYEFWAWDLRH